MTCIFCFLHCKPQEKERADNAETDARLARQRVHARLEGSGLRGHLGLELRPLDVRDGQVVLLHLLDRALEILLGSFKGRLEGRAVALSVACKGEFSTQGLANTA